MLETIIVIIAVATAVIYLLWRLWESYCSARRGDACAGCALRKACLKKKGQA
ncbi:MAG: FeoB-associated Cys-rich membrane protein [Prevotella sp.]|nr:hypothetical protein [Prevotella sp.]MCR5152319.1 FeoB-associated Cys-rich membrane protein [Prevotella sp.]